MVTPPLPWAAQGKSKGKLRQRLSAQHVSADKGFVQQHPSPAASKALPEEAQSRGSEGEGEEEWD